MTQERSAEVMHRYLMEVVGEGKLELIPELADEDMVDHSSNVAGIVGLEQHVRGFRECLPDIQVEVQRVIASEDEVVGIWRVQGTHSAPLFGVPATGKRLDYVNSSVFRLRDGKIVDYMGVWGALTAVRQMGVKIES